MSARVALLVVACSAGCATAPARFSVMPAHTHVRFAPEALWLTKLTGTLRNTSPRPITVAATDEFAISIDFMICNGKRLRPVQGTRGWVAMPRTWW